MKIWISGCARTGTTLMNRLFYSFADVGVIDQEIPLNHFVQMPEPVPVIVGKRSDGSLFADGNTQEELERQAALIISEGIRVLVMTRNGEDVLRRGRGKDVPVERLRASLQQLVDYPAAVSMIVSYEDLCNQPDDVQGIIADHFNLRIEHPFSEYPAFVPEKTFSVGEFKNLENYGSRPISTESITGA